MSQSARNLAARIDADYARLNEFASSLTEVARDAVAPGDFVEWKIETLFRVRDFRNQLAKHFDLEEEGGFIADLLRLAPESANRIALLTSEHAGILDAVDKAIRRLKTADQAAPDVVDRLRVDLDDIMKQLKRHESVEKELLYSAHNQVYGAGD